MGETGGVSVPDLTEERTQCVCLSQNWAVGTVCWPSLARFWGLEKESFLKELSGLSSPSQKQQAAGAGPMGQCAGEGPFVLRQWEKRGLQAAVESQFVVVTAEVAPKAGNSWSSG